MPVNKGKTTIIYCVWINKNTIYGGFSALWAVDGNQIV